MILRLLSVGFLVLLVTDSSVQQGELSRSKGVFDYELCISMVFEAGNRFHSPTTRSRFVGTAIYKW